MNAYEKLGLLQVIFGSAYFSALFILGQGDATAATYNGESIPVIYPICCLILGAALFSFGDKLNDQ